MVIRGSVQGDMLLPCAALLAACLGSASAHDPDHDYGKPLWNATYTDLLKRDLLATYDKFARPSHHSNATKVNLDLDLRHVDLDDSKSLFTVNAWVRLAWKDDKLQWNASDYGGLSILHLADHEIWEPDIVLYNSALGNNIDHYGNTHCIAQPTGEVLWVPPSQFVVFCELDLSKWPFDRHTCTLRLGSWTYNGEQVDLQIPPRSSKEVTEPKMDVKVEWNVINVTKSRHVTYYSCCLEPYIDLDFTITVERRSAAYRAIVIIPAICTMLVTLTSLWLPGRERFFLSSLSALLAALFLVYFTLRLPVSGPNTPLIVLFYAYNLMMITISIVLTVICHNLSTSQIRLPRFVVNLLRGTLATILLLPSPKSKINYTQHGYEEDGGPGAEELREYETVQEDRRILSRKGPQESWILATAAIDRFVFTTYVLVFVSFAFRALL